MLMMEGCLIVYFGRHLFEHRLVLVNKIRMVRLLTTHRLHHPCLRKTTYEPTPKTSHTKIYCIVDLRTN